MVNSPTTRQLPEPSCNALTAANFVQIFVSGTLFPLTAGIAHVVSLHSSAALLLTSHAGTTHTPFHPVQSPLHHYLITPRFPSSTPHFWRSASWSGRACDELYETAIGRLRRLRARKETAPIASCDWRLGRRVVRHTFAL